MPYYVPVIFETIKNYILFMKVLCIVLFMKKGFIVFNPMSKPLRPHVAYTCICASEGT